MSRFEAADSVNGRPTFQMTRQFDLYDLMNNSTVDKPARGGLEQSARDIDFDKYADPFAGIHDVRPGSRCSNFGAERDAVNDKNVEPFRNRSTTDEQAVLGTLFDTLEKYLPPEQMNNFLEDFIKRLAAQFDRSGMGGYDTTPGAPPRNPRQGIGDGGHGNGGTRGDGNGKTGGDGNGKTGGDGNGKTGGDGHSGTDFPNNDKGLSKIPSHASVFNNVEKSDWKKNGNQAETALPAGADPSTANPANKITRMDVKHGPDGVSFYTEGTNYADSLYSHVLTREQQSQNDNHFRWSFDVTGGVNSDKAQAMEMDLWQARKEGDHYTRYMFGSQIAHDKLQIWDEKNQHWIDAAKLPMLKPGEKYHMEYDLVRTDDGRMWYKGITVNGKSLPLEHNIQFGKRTDWSNPSVGIQYQQDLKKGVPWGETVNNIHVASWHDTTVEDQLRRAGLS